MTLPQVEVVTSVERGRRWSREEKEALVAVSFEPGVTDSEIARSTGVHVSQLYRWRKDLCRRADWQMRRRHAFGIVHAHGR